MIIRNTILTAMLAASAFALGGEAKHLFILTGQSNMVGLKEEQSFVPVVEKAFGKDKVIVIKEAHNGRPIRRWYKQWKSADGKTLDDREPNGNVYESLMAKVKSAIEGQKLDSVTLIWMQGERDARERHGEVYAESFRGVLAQLKEDLKRDDLFFVIGRIGAFDMENRNYPHWTMVRDAQVAVAEADPRGSWIDTDDFGGGLHYSAAGYQKLGEAFAEAAVAQIKKKN